jgi:hypothetical protein
VGPLFRTTPPTPSKFSIPGPGPSASRSRPAAPRRLRWRSAVDIALSLSTLWRRERRIKVVAEPHNKMRTEAQRLGHPTFPYKLPPGRHRDGQRPFRPWYLARPVVAAGFEQLGHDRVAHAVASVERLSRSAAP